ncbi:MAG TPA: hypothetical protein VLB09_09875 [Nitrospiria bacterium]|nr:hypothetical protein [Nitrospiria bacterium]
MDVLTRKHATFALLLLFFVAWGYLLSIYKAEEIVHSLGITNVYVVVFFASTIGGVSTFFAGSFYATIMTFAIGGLDPLALGLIAGFGATIGDSIFYYLGYRGREVLSGRWRDKAMGFSKWLRQQNDMVITTVIFLYAAATPLPKDLLVAALAVGDYRYFKMIPPLLLGNICLISLIGYVVLMVR